MVAGDMEGFMHPFTPVFTPHYKSTSLLILISYKYMGKIEQSKPLLDLVLLDDAPGAPGNGLGFIGHYRA